MTKYLLAFSFGILVNNLIAHEALHVTKEAGIVYPIFGVKIVEKISSEQTSGQYSVIETTTPAGGGPPLHLHLNEDELFYVVEGKYKFYCGDQVIKAETGSFVFLPKGTPHRFENIGKAKGITINTITPGGFEKFFAEINQLAKVQQRDRKKIAQIATKYKLSFIEK
ncbi:MAG: cupin domain-containing protein [Lentisphaeria bacterium]|nr:cupin domain-containing protein [Lentisphaeria bacterium]